MSNNARRVTEAEALGESEPVNQDEPLRSRYGAETRGPAVYISGDIYDRIRLEARESAYPNSQAEAATIAEVDRRIFERIQGHERRTIDQAEHLIAAEDHRAVNARTNEPTRNAIQRAEAHVTALLDLRDELGTGRKSTAELADQYTRIKTAITVRDGHALVALRDKAEGLRRKVADPVAAAQRTLTRMPANLWRPLGVGQW